MAKETPLKYSQLLDQSQQELDQQEKSFQVEQANLQLQSDISATNQSLLSAKKDLAAAYITKPFSSQAIISAQDKVTILEAGIKRLSELQKQLF